MSNSSYFITGGFGLIGSQLANSLEGDITIFARSTKNQDRIKNKNAKVITKDMLEIEGTDLKGVDTIYHLASTVDNYNVLTDPYIDAETNIKGTVKLLEACKDLPKKPQIVFLSTFFVYGNEYERTGAPLDEESKTEPLAIYPATKLCAESIIKLYSRLYNIPYLILRLTNIFSEYEDYKNKKKGALNYMIMRAIKGETLSIYKGGNFYRDFLYLDDAISAIKFLEEKDIHNDTFLVGYGKPVLLKDFMNYVHEVTGKKSHIEEVEPPEFHNVVGIRNFVANTSKINKLGWEAKVDYKEGIRKIIERYKDISTD